MTGAELERHAAELGIDMAGAAPAAPYEATERAIGERRERGLFASMRFTMARPEVACHPERLLAGARTVVSAALCHYLPAPPPGRGEGLLPRYAWRDRYRELRGRLDALGQRLGGAYRVLVDESDHVDREGAARAGLGFYGKNTMLITRLHGSWVALGTLVTEAAVEPAEPVRPGCGSCTLCIDACPTGALVEPGVLDATRCLSYLTQAPGALPVEHRAALGARVYGCDVCQEVCPWNRGVERRRAGERAGPGDEPAVPLRKWLEADPSQLRRRYARLYVPRNDGRHLQRNAIVAAGNAGDRSLAPLLERHARGGDELLAEHARWALEQLATSVGATAPAPAAGARGA
ncbi:MAG: tRNA epoxyqueuosine(34) reductase QueG [Thermoleophilia bacterium]|nr:tRNA epoxyqueuosine(34) reductase QueG [Thermoleophilia bacterium]